jgi:hypothetical protein
MIEKLKTCLGKAGWRVSVTHREAAKFEAARANQKLHAKE